MISENLKSKVTHEIKRMITEIRLNEAIIINDFSAIFEGNVLLVEFEIPEEISLLKKIEFFEEESLLSECKVYVPINGNTLFKYRIEVK
ncbi:hypothetical protein [Enterococcus sp.]|uniref:hypothetical protein n=1 Tax=Enterococcus sp. TaxID=35783 RepID=UPI0025C420A0|nr:hypothetical protein [Enterococcus sp.]